MLPFKVVLWRIRHAFAPEPTLKKTRRHQVFLPSGSFFALIPNRICSFHFRLTPMRRVGAPRIPATFHQERGGLGWGRQN